MRITIIVIALVIAVQTVAAGPYEDAVAAEKRGDYSTALRLLKPLAEAGNVDAQTEFATLLHFGWGVSKNDEEAVKWLRMAADKGGADAQDALGFAYYRGEGVAQNYAEAAKWLRRAAEQGLANSQNKLGFMYEAGQGVPQDFVLAHYWFNLAAAKDAVYSQNRDRLTASMTTGQIAEAQKLARDWKPKAER